MLKDLNRHCARLAAAFILASRSEGTKLSHKAAVREAVAFYKGRADPKKVLDILRRQRHRRDEEFLPIKVVTIPPDSPDSLSEDTEMCEAVGFTVVVPPE